MQGLLTSAASWQNPPFHSYSHSWTQTRQQYPLYSSQESSLQDGCFWSQMILSENLYLHSWETSWSEKIHINFHSILNSKYLIELSIRCWEICIQPVAHAPVEKVGKICQACCIIVKMCRWLHHPVNISLTLSSHLLVWSIFPCKGTLMEQDRVKFMNCIFP